MIQSYDNLNLPLDILWLDSSSLAKDSNFKIDEQIFPDFKKLSDSLHSKNRSLIAYIPPGLSAQNLDD